MVDSTKEKKNEQMRSWLKTPAGRDYLERQRDYRKQWRKKNKEQYQSVKQQSEDAVRMEALIHYSQTNPPQCSLCGAKKGLKLRLSPVLPKQDPYWMKRNNWPEGFRVLCFSCVKKERSKRLTLREVPIWLDTQTGKHHNDKRESVQCGWCKIPLLKQQCHVSKNVRGAYFCSPECHGKWNSENLVGEKHPFWIPRVRVSCGYCNKELWRKKAEVEKSKTGKFFCGQACAGPWKSENLNGPLIYNWKGGYEPYYGPNWNVQRNRARARDEFTCQRCSITEEVYGKQLDVHHKTPFREFGIERYLEANDLDNLISFCNRCHKIVEEETNGRTKPNTATTTTSAPASR